MRVRPGVALLAAFLTVIAGSLTGCGAAGDDRSQGPRPIPTFSSAPRSGAAGPARPRETLLPLDCTDVLPGADMPALLGQPVDSIQTRTVIGVESPSVGLVERVTCLYQRAGDRDGPLALTLRLQAYTTPAASERHTMINVAAERADSRFAEEFAIGSAHAVLLGQGGQTVLMVSSGRSSVAMTLRRGVVADDQTRPVMVDLAQRVLPNLAPERTGESR